MAINFDKAFGVHPLALSLREQRTSLLAANLANADTPGYKARDIDFESVLRQKLGTSEGVSLQATNARHLGDAAARGVAEPLYRVPSEPSLDGNTVEGEDEQVAFADNAVAYQASLRFINGKIGGLLTAIKGQ
ncbi:flagellar basal body rod protein FlgB [Methylogaea oryzae]|uniref:Flagellar basal body rod protein FlgB n=1 Tax=Methylogaea oryzae TaxID=1295382 RepID=A0A8D4VP49_9GAMM|nr:flagellar basal body rod protein FlgB [Methylogaea oryzae]BBL70652.1 flagellar basal body rod protein FlgB [Methylogaea oryzae]